MIINIFEDGKPLRVHRFVRNVEIDTTVFASELKITFQDGTTYNDLVIHGEQSYTIRKEFKV